MWWCCDRDSPTLGRPANGPAGFFAVPGGDIRTKKESLEFVKATLDTGGRVYLYDALLRDTGASAPMPLCEIQRRDRLNQPASWRQETGKKGLSVARSEP
jgi:hypothetical protein